MRIWVKNPIEMTPRWSREIDVGIELKLLNKGYFELTVFHAGAAKVVLN